MEKLAKALENLGFWKEANEVRQNFISDHTKWIREFWKI